MIKLEAETAAFMEKTFDLLMAMKRSNPQLDTLLSSGPARLSFDARERAILVSVVTGETGHAEAIAAIGANPSDREGFGEIVIPIAIQAGAQPDDQWH